MATRTRARATRTEAPPKATTLLLVRHAVTHQTGPILSGRTPGIDLSDTGRAQARALGERLAGLPVAAVYASPIERTMQTAAAVAAHHSLRVRRLSGMVEADYGEWTGRKLAELAKTPLWRVVQHTPSVARFPGGESIREMQARAVATCERVVADHPGEMVVVVSHSDVIKAAAAHFTGLALDLFQRLHVSPASVTALAYSGHGISLLTLNALGDLRDVLPGATPATDGAAASQGRRRRRG